MARARRGAGGRWRTGGSPALDLQGTLGNLLRTTLEQVGVVRDAVERQTRTSRVRLDGVLLQRKRRDELARLGELAYDLSIRGRLHELAEQPEAIEIIAAIEALEDQIGAAEDSARSEDGVVSAAAARMPQAPRRHDEASRVWRPVLDDEPGDRASSEGERTNAPPEAHGADQPAQASERDAPAGERTPWERVPGAGRPQSAGRAPGSRAPRLDAGPGRERGGIAFVSDAADAPDEDLRDYMHPDDVRPGRSDDHE